MRNIPTRIVIPQDKSTSRNVYVRNVDGLLSLCDRIDSGEIDPQLWIRQLTNNVVMSYVHEIHCGNSESILDMHKASAPYVRQILAAMKNSEMLVAYFDGIESRLTVATQTANGSVAREGHDISGIVALAHEIDAEITALLGHDGRTEQQFPLCDVQKDPTNLRGKRKPEPWELGPFREAEDPLLVRIHPRVDLEQFRDPSVTFDPATIRQL